MTRRAFLTNLGLACAALGLPVAARQFTPHAFPSVFTIDQRWLAFEKRRAMDREHARYLAAAMGIREAARRVGVSENTVLTWAKRDGWLSRISA